MKPEQVKELWMLRFKKIAAGEKEALLFYKELLLSYKDILEDTKTKGLLEEIEQDEARHYRIANELLDLLKRKKIRKRSVAIR